MPHAPFTIPLKRSNTVIHHKPTHPPPEEMPVILTLSAMVTACLSLPFIILATTPNGHNGRTPSRRSLPRREVVRTIVENAKRQGGELEKTDDKFENSSEETIKPLRRTATDDTLVAGKPE
ncbi:Protein of unknown function [Pyronema omphalodes CBS 100304]|uniref:Uncharacterized protein n=1 Tax=Pyronema omphalodes (strain CBS 100304) TaxID=1076935 RepID=U4L024_PYROM|nr:Protein of unknown function [Pyronema omphalodes CBS 100304]